MPKINKLTLAAINNRDQEIEELLAAGEDVNCLDYEGCTPLIAACALGRIRAVQAFLKSENVIVNYCTLHNQRTALSVAVFFNQSEVVQILLQDERIDPNGSVLYGQTPLMLAVDRDNLRIVQLLAKHPRIRVNQLDEHGHAALTYAAAKGLLPIVRLLLKVPGINVNGAANDINDLPITLRYALKQADSTTRSLIIASNCNKLESNASAIKAVPDCEALNKSSAAGANKATSKIVRRQIALR